MGGSPEGLSGNDLTYYNYPPITFTDVERWFSQYKNILADHNFGDYLMLKIFKKKISCA